MALDLIWLGLALLLAPVFGVYGKVAKKKERRGFTWLAGAGALYLLAAAFSVEIPWVPSGLEYGTIVFSVIALIATLIGALMIIANVFK